MNIINIQEKGSSNRRKKGAGVGGSKVIQKNLTPEDKAKWFNAIFENDVDTVKSMIKAQPDILHVRNYMGTALHIAVRYEHIETVKCLLKAGADANASNEEGEFVLQTAAKKGNAGIVSALLPFVNNIDIRSDGGCHTPMLWAITFGHVSVAKVLLDAGADIEARHFQSVPLTGALLCDHAEVIKFLIKRGADVEEICYDGNTVLGLAAQYGSFYSLCVLLESGANIHAKQGQGQSLLALALNKAYHSIGRDDKCIRALVDAGAMVTPEENQQYPFLCNAMKRKYPANLIHTLINVGISVDKKDENGVTPLEMAITSDCVPKPQRDQIVKWLLENGANPNVKDKSGNTPLHTAVTSNQKEVVHSLVEHGADIEARDDEGNTPLGSVVIFAYIDLLTALLEHGADIHAKQQSGQSLLALALNIKQVFETFDDACIRKLLEAGATVTPEEDQQYPFLCNGINKGYPEDILVSLVKSGISIDRKDDKGYTPLLNAIHSGREDLAIALIKAGATRDTLCEVSFNALTWANVKKQWNVIAAIIEQGGIMAAFGAVMLDRVDILEKMKGLDVNSLDYRNDTLLHYAVRWNKLEVTRWLLAMGANPNLKNTLGVTPLQRAIFRKNHVLIKELLRSGADVTIPSDKGKDALALLSENYFSFYYQPHTDKYS